MILAKVFGTIARGRTATLVFKTHAADWQVLEQVGETGHQDSGRTMLAEIYNWFTEGFDTADPKEAKALIEQLSN